MAERIRITELPDLGVVHVTVGRSVLLAVGLDAFRLAAEAFVDALRRRRQ